MVPVAAACRVVNELQLVGTTKQRRGAATTHLLNDFNAGLQYVSCQAAPATVLDLEGQYPDMDAALKLVKNNERDLAAYLNDTNTVCTFFIPTSEVRAVTYVTRAK